MEVRLAEKRGFCFGVEDAVELAEKAVREHGPGKVIALGPVVHNNDVVDRLEQAGLDQSGEIESIPDGSNILVRSHGATPELYDQARARGLNVVDATCILVKKAQDAVKQLHDEGYCVILIGDPHHPEVKGVLGYAPDIIVLDSVEELDDKLPYRERLGIVAQTTHAPEHVAHIIGHIAARPYQEMKVINTLCLEVVRRQESAVALAREVDVLFVLGGLHSANTRELARLAAGITTTHHIESVRQFESTMVGGCKVAGVTAGASTPDSVVQEFVAMLEAL